MTYLVELNLWAKDKSDTNEKKEGAAKTMTPLGHSSLRVHNGDVMGYRAPTHEYYLSFYPDKSTIGNNLTLRDLFYQKVNIVDSLGEDILYWKNIQPTSTFILPIEQSQIALILQLIQLIIANKDVLRFSIPSQLTNHIPGLKESFNCTSVIVAILKDAGVNFPLKKRFGWIPSGPSPKMLTEYFATLGLANGVMDVTSLRKPYYTVQYEAAKTRKEQKEYQEQWAKFGYVPVSTPFSGGSFTRAPVCFGHAPVCLTPRTTCGVVSTFVAPTPRFG